MLKHFGSFTVAVLLLIPSLSFGWGAEGHEAVCEIAYRELNPAARQAVDEIMAQESNASLRSLRKGCGWPDHSGDLQTARRGDHYVNVPRHWGAIFDESCPEANSCLFTAIWKDLSIVSRRSAPPRERLVALKFLGHWLGDIHQPLHVSYSDDRGGNEILLTQDLGCRPKLHDVWDNCMPEHLMLAAGVGTDTLAFGKTLQAQITPALRNIWTANLTPLTWANESYEITRRDSVGYCSLRNEGRVCWYSMEQREFIAAEELPHEGRREVTLSTAYRDELETIARERIMAAGVRLGALLNQALSE